jgi:capsular polysaccharide biosynthesis protein
MINNTINFINYIDNIKILNNNSGIDHINNINIDLLNNDDNNNLKIDIYNNCLLESKKNGDFTSYNIHHLAVDYINEDNLRPNIGTLNYFYYINCNKLPNDNSLIIENGVFFNSLTSIHFELSHLIFDFTQHINIFYDLLKKNEDYVIILEIINKTTFYNNFFSEPGDATININKFIQFIRDIGLNNKIITISVSSNHQNFDNDSLFIKNIHTVSYQKINNLNWIPLISRFSKNENNEYFSDTMKKILEKKSQINIHYQFHGQKFFILEKNAFFLDNKNFIINEKNFKNIYYICNIYCLNNNLRLVIWENILNDNTSIYEQFNIANNAEIIIGSNWETLLYNCSNTCSKILIMNLLTEYNNQYKILYQITFYSFMSIYKNKSIKDIYLHFKNNNEDYLNYYKIVFTFLVNSENKINFNNIINYLSLDTELLNEEYKIPNIDDVRSRFNLNVITKNNILIDNLNNCEILYDDANLSIILNTQIINNTRLIINNNNIYIDKLPSYNIINKYLEEYIIHEQLFDIYINNNFINLYGCYLNLINSSNSNYYHFLFDTLPYLFSFLKNNNLLYNDNYNFNILVNHDYNIIKSLFNINIKYSDTNYNIENLIIPKNINPHFYLCWNKYNILQNKDIYYYDYNIFKELREFIFNKFNIIPHGNKNIYLKRNNDFRIFINSDYFNKIINDFNFDIVLPENMSFYEQVSYFSQVKTLVCQGGAGMANILFMPENSNVILIIADSKFINITYFKELLLKLNINLNIIYTTTLYLYDNIYENNLKFIQNFNLAKHPFNCNLYFNKKNFIDLIKLLEKYTNKINYNFNYFIEINNNIQFQYNFYLKNMDNSISRNIDFDNILEDSYIYMILK